MSYCALSIAAGVIKYAHIIIIPGRVCNNSKRVECNNLAREMHVSHVANRCVSLDKNITGSARLKRTRSTAKVKHAFWDCPLTLCLSLSLLS